MTIEFNPSERSYAFGHHFVVGLSGPLLSREDKELLRRLRPIGLYLSARNFLRKDYPEWRPIYQQLLSEGYKYTEREKIFAVVDGSAGTLPTPFDRWSSANHLLPTQPEQLDCMAAALKSLGVNLWLGPRLDAVKESKLHQDPALRTEHLLHAVQRFREQGLTGCIRYFPGYNGAARDPREPLRSYHHALPQHALLPFRDLIGHGAKIIITSHHIYSHLDPLEPASLSERVIRALLRDEFGFRSIVMTDDVDMRAVADRFHNADGAARTISAGTDLILVSRLSNPFGTYPLHFAHSIYEALKARRLKEEGLFESFERIRNVLESSSPAGSVRVLAPDAIRNFCAVVDEAT